MVHPNWRAFSPRPTSLRVFETQVPKPERSASLVANRSGKLAAVRSYSLNVKKNEKMAHGKLERMVGETIL
jgi:hypothetical protein